MALCVVLVVQAGVLAADAVAVQTAASVAARTAAVSGDAAARSAVHSSLGQQAAVELHPAGGRVPGELVTATVRLRSAAFRVFGRHVELSARAAFPEEAR